MASDARLIWGSTALISAQTENDLRAASSPPAYIIQASADGTNFGNPQAVITEIRSHLQDGSLASVTSFDNREGTVTLMVSALTHDALGKAEAALVAETKVPGFSTLSWTPSVALSVPPTVYDVVYSSLSWQFDDLNEIKRSNGVLRRFFTATFELLPFGHDATPTSVVASAGTTPTPTTPTSVSAASSTTGWSGGSNNPNAVVLSVQGGTAVRVQTSGATTNMFGAFSTTAAGQGAVDLSTNRYIMVDLTVLQTVSGVGIYLTPFSLNGYISPTTSVSDAVTMTLVSTSASPVNPAYTRYYFLVPASFGNSGIYLQFSASYPGVSTSTAYMQFDQISSANALPVTTTNRERPRSATIGGSARCRASITVTADATKTLGDLTMVYTRSAATGFQPWLVPYATSAGTTNTALISGQVAAIGTTAKTFRVPARLLKESLHGLVARTQATTAGTYTLTYTAALKSSVGATLPESSQSITGSVSVTYPAANTWQTNEVGGLQLPTVPVGLDSTHVIEITLQASNNVVQLDEAWLFDLDNGVLSWLDTTGLTRLEIRPADLTNPEPSYWGGTVDGGAATGLIRADYRTVPAMSVTASNGGSFGQHFIEPGTADIFAVTSGTEGSSVTLVYSRSFLHNVSS